MKKLAKGGFEIKDWKENPAGAKTGPKVTRASVKQRYTGDIKGTGTIEYVMSYRPDKTAEYTGVEVITGSIGTRKGSISLLIRGTYDGKAVTGWQVIAGAGRGALKNLTGKGEFSAPMGSKGKYTLTYELPDQEFVAAGRMLKRPSASPARASASSPSAPAAGTETRDPI